MFQQEDTEDNQGPLKRDKEVKIWPYMFLVQWRTRCLSNLMLHELTFYVEVF